MAEKRKDAGNGNALIKRSKPNDEDNSVITLSNQRSGTQNAIVGTVRRKISSASMSNYN